MRRRPAKLIVNPAKYLNLKNLKNLKNRKDGEIVATATATKPKSTKAAASTSAADPSLFEIGRDKIAFEQLIEECGGNVADPKVAEAATSLAAEIADAEGRKLDGWIWWYTKVKADEALFKSQKDYWARKEKAAEATQKWQKFVFFNHLKTSGVDEIETPLKRAIYLATNPSPAPVVFDADVDPTTLPDEFTVFNVEIDHEALVTILRNGGSVPGVKLRRSMNDEAIRQVIQAGGEVPGVKLGERGQHVRIK